MRRRQTVLISCSKNITSDFFIILSSWNNLPFLCRQGLIPDLRGNPGGLLTSAVDVSSLFVPKGIGIVSVKGRGFPGIRYISRVDPIFNPQSTKVAILVNEGTAPADEVVSSAIQDLDMGVITH